MSLNFLNIFRKKKISQPYVDLRLPSRTKWAMMNVGAQKETDSGLYFAWGETVGYSSIINTKAKFTWDTYRYGKETNITRYNSTDRLTKLDLFDDVAFAYWGDKWRMPSVKQIEELLNPKNCTNKWVENYNGSGVNGRLFVSVRNGKKLFIPAAGYYLGEVGNNGWVWSCELNDNFERGAECLAISSSSNNGASLIANDRCIGIPIRLVFK